MNYINAIGLQVFFLFHMSLNLLLADTNSRNKSEYNSFTDRVDMTDVRYIANIRAMQCTTQFIRVIIPTHSPHYNKL